MQAVKWQIKMVQTCKTDHNRKKLMELNKWR